MTNEKIFDLKITEVKYGVNTDSYWRVDHEGGTIDSFSSLHGAIDACDEWGYTYEIIELDDKFDVKITEVKYGVNTDSYWRVDHIGGTIDSFSSLHGAIDACDEWGYTYEIIELDDKHDLKAIYQDFLNFINVQASAPSDDAVTGFIDMLDKTYNVSKKQGAINDI